MTATTLLEVVELNEAAKTIRRYAFEVSLSALGAIVRSSHAAAQLRGFNEVASQMRGWSRDLENAVVHVNTLTGQRVRWVSDWTRASRLLRLLEKTRQALNDSSVITARIEDEARLVMQLGAELRRVDDQLDDALDEIGRLGLMASVLSRAALIEVASGGSAEQAELTVCSKEFSAYAERVNDAVTATRARRRGLQR